LGSKIYRPGSKAFLAEHGVDVASVAEQDDRLREEGATDIFAGVDGKVAGAIAIADPVKASTAEDLAGLKAQGVRLVMLTGDSWTTAKAVAKRLGIDGGRGRGAQSALRYPVLSPTIAAAAMALSSVSMIANAIRLRTTCGCEHHPSQAPAAGQTHVGRGCGRVDLLLMLNGLVVHAWGINNKHRLERRADAPDA
jgi:cation transport ATPase